MTSCSGLLRSDRQANPYDEECFEPIVHDDSLEHGTVPRLFEIAHPITRHGPAMAEPRTTRQPLVASMTVVAAMLAITATEVAAVMVQPRTRA